MEAYLRGRAEVTSVLSALTEHSPPYLAKHLTHGMQLFQKTNFKGLFSQCCDSQTQNTPHLKLCNVLLNSATDTAQPWSSEEAGTLLVLSSSCALPYCL